MCNFWLTPSTISQIVSAMPPKFCALCSIVRVRFSDTKESAPGCYVYFNGCSSLTIDFALLEFLTHRLSVQDSPSFVLHSA